VTTEIAMPDDDRPKELMKLTAAEIKADVNLIQQVLKSVFKKDVHYGVIPGTAKNTLYKPGAEKIMTTFRLNGEPLVDDLSTADEKRIRVRVRITHQVSKLEIGWGVGECSSNETKYKWIKAEKWAYDGTPEDQRRIIWKPGKTENYPVMQVRANIADVANTVLKMAKKRALIDATLTCTAASDVFEQDLEDMPEGVRQNIVDEKRPPMPERTPAPSMQKPIIADENKNPAADEEEEQPPKAKINLAGARDMLAKFDAPCKICEEIIQTGMPMLYIGQGVDKGRYHVSHKTA
jgi:hypothetical protein